MIDAIQNAYYQQALNPSDNDILIALATKIGLPEKAFQEKFTAEQTQLILEQQLSQCQQMNARSYPSLILKIGTGYWPVSIDYHNIDVILDNIKMILEFEH